MKVFKCPYCGSSILTNDKFCSFCGKGISEEYKKNTTNKIKRTITMKKNVKSILAGLAAAALLAGFSSCSNGSSDDTLTSPKFEF